MESEAKPEPFRGPEANPERRPCSDRTLESWLPPCCEDKLETNTSEVLAQRLLDTGQSRAPPEQAPCLVPPHTF